MPSERSKGVNESCADGRRRWVVVAVLLTSVWGCGTRSDDYEQPFVAGEAVGLSAAVAVSDSTRNEVMLLRSPGEGELDLRRLKVGKNIVATAPSFDRQNLFVLTSGDSRRLEESDEHPQLFVIDGGLQPGIKKVYQLENALKKLALDPSGEWAIVHQADGVVVNENELILVNLKDDDAAPIKKTIRSHGGSPERFTFTEPLAIPGGTTHRLLVVETDQDVAIVDLTEPEAPEITIELPKTKTGQIAKPAQVVFHDDAGDGDERASYLALRFENDTSLLTLNLSAPTASASANGHAFSVVPNLLDAAGVPSAIDFVITDRGLRLAALVPTQSTGLLFDPTTSKSERVKFDAAYSGIARVTSWVDQPPANGDVALLFSSVSPNIAFWRLGTASATPYASFDSYQVEASVTQVLAIPGQEFSHMKLLLGASSEFFLLDLRSRLSYPMRALNNFNLSLSPAGEQAWAFLNGGLDIARLTFADRHPATFPVERPVSGVYDIARADGGRSALVLHRPYAGGDLGVTLFDGEAPDSARTRFVSSLKLEGWQ